MPETVCSAPGKNNKIKKQIESLIDDNVDEELILSRTLDINGKSQAKINMHNVPLTVLKNVTSLILDIHSQQKDNNYLKEENQLNLLDSFSELLLSKDEKEIFNEFNKSYKDFRLYIMLGFRKSKLLFYNFLFLGFIYSLIYLGLVLLTYLLIKENVFNIFAFGSYIFSVLLSILILNNLLKKSYRE